MFCPFLSTPSGLKTNKNKLKCWHVLRFPRIYLPDELLQKGNTTTLVSPLSVPPTDTQMVSAF
jgi:hypothetical protein